MHRRRSQCASRLGMRRGEIVSCASGSGIRWLFLLSVPSCFHPLSPTRISVVSHLIVWPLVPIAREPNGRCIFGGSAGRRATPVVPFILPRAVSLSPRSDRARRMDRPRTEHRCAVPREQRTSDSFAPMTTIAHDSLGRQPSGDRKMFVRMHFAHRREGEERDPSFKKFSGHARHERSK